MQTGTYKNRRGIAIIVVVVALAIMMMLGMMQITGFLTPLPETKDSVIDVDRPWLEADNYLDENNVVFLPEEPKPLLGDGIKLEAAVERTGKPRGTVIIEVADSGNVFGNWSCTYAIEQRQYSYSATFKGNIDIDHTFEDGNGVKDKSRLFFFTRGNYTKQTFNKTSNVMTEDSGDVYVIGWIDPDHSASGRITITTDETWAAVYQWQTTE